MTLSEIFFLPEIEISLFEKTIEQIEIIKGGSEIMKFFFYRDAWIEQSGN